MIELTVYRDLIGIQIAGMRPILLATDNPNDVFSFWVYHKQCGVQNRVEVLSDGTDVVRYLEGDRARSPLPALLVASLKMPQMGGVQLLAHLKKAGYRDFPGILLIDEQDHDLGLVATAFQAGTQRFLMRPVKKKEFCEIMSAFEAITMDGCRAVYDSASSSDWLTRRAGGHSLSFGRSEPSKPAH